MTELELIKNIYLVEKKIYESNEELCKYTASLSDEPVWQIYSETVKEVLNQKLKYEKAKLELAKNYIEILESTKTDDQEKIEKMLNNIADVLLGGEDLLQDLRDTMKLGEAMSSDLFSLEDDEDEEDGDMTKNDGWSWDDEDDSDTHKC